MEQDKIPTENNALLALTIFKNEYCSYEKCDTCEFLDDEMCKLNLALTRLRKEAEGIPA